MATIQGVYVALFARPADPTGLAYFKGVTKNGADLSGIGDLAATKEYIDRFAGKTNLQIIDSIYQSLFNRSAEAVGLNFFADALSKGTLSIKNIAIAILDGAQGNDKTIVTNKIAAADLFTSSIDTSAEVAAYSGQAGLTAGKAFLVGVGIDSKTVPDLAATDAAIAAIVSPVTTGVAITTDGSAAQAVSPTASDTKYKTTSFDDTITATATPSTLKVDGGDGVDTLKVTTTEFWHPASGLIANVEKLFVSGSYSVDIKDLIGFNEVWVDGAQSGYSISGIKTGTVLGLKGHIFAAELHFEQLQTSSTTVILDKVTTDNPVTLHYGAKTVLMSTSGGSQLIFDDADVQKLVISGSGELNLYIGSAVSLSTLDASGLDGKLAVDLRGVYNPLDVNHYMTIIGSRNPDAIVLIDKGVSLDTIFYNRGELSTYQNIEKIYNFDSHFDKLSLKDFALTNKAIQKVSSVYDGMPFGATSVIQVSDGVNTTLFINTSGNNNSLDLASDLAIQLTGHVSADLSAANFIF